MIIQYLIKVAYQVTGEKFKSLNNDKSRKELRNEIIDSAMTALADKDFDKLNADTLMKIIERMSYVDSFSKEEQTQKEELQEIVNQIEALNGTDEEAN